MSIIWEKYIPPFQIFAYSLNPKKAAQAACSVNRIQAKPVPLLML
jgi:hypothetical protein